MGALIALVIQELPSLIPEIKGLFTAQNPGAPEPTDAEVHAALLAAIAATLSKDDDWLNSHKPTSDQ
jgi:hypothetical protein